uniref:Uncharacterized protein n=1 Tax=Musca domestica TaxID=7370 RepID=A0A1I8MIC3_MUSDO
MNENKINFQQKYSSQQIVVMAVPAKNGGSVSDKNKKQKSFRKSVLLFRCFALLIVIASATAAAATTTTTTATPATATSSQKDSVGIVVNDDDNDGVGGGLSQAKQGCTDLARDEETLMVFSTLGGGLTAIDPITSEIRWTIADGNYDNPFHLFMYTEIHTHLRMGTIPIINTSVFCILFTFCICHTNKWLYHCK